MIDRLLAAILGGMLFGVLLPICSAVLIGMPDTLMGFVWLAVTGIFVGGILGASFTRVFGFVFEIFLDV
jgi:hypothetical protein